MSFGNLLTGFGAGAKSLRRMNQEDDAIAAERENRRLALEDRDLARKRQEAQDQKSDISLEMQMRNSGYVPEMEAGDEAPITLDNLIGSTSAGPTAAKAPRYSSGPKGWRYDNEGPVAKGRSLEQSLKETQIRRAEREANAPYKTPTTENIDPLSPAGIRAAGERARLIASTKSTAPKQKILPTSAVEKLSGMDNMIDQATEVSAALDHAIKTKVDVTGRALGVFRTPTWAKNAMGMGGNVGKDTRALIGSLYGTIAKERAGTSMTPGELNLLESYLPNENEDEATALIKANRFIRTLKHMRANKEKAYQKYGYNSTVDADTQIVDDVEAGLPNP